MTLENGFGSYARDFISRNCARQQHDVRSPLYARRLIEFAFSVPERQRRRGDVNKHMHLHALSRDLPPELLSRKTKAMANSVFERQLDSVRDLMLIPRLQGDFNWLELDGLSQLFRNYDSQPTACKPVYGLWTVYGCWNLFGLDAVSSRSPK